MRKHTKQILGLIFIVLLFISNTYAGNKQRIAQAGASELLLNPWGRSTGLGEANVANIAGLEGIFGNVAGTAHLKSTQLIFTNSQFLTLSGQSNATYQINNFGLSQKIGNVGVISISVALLDWGEVDKTTVEIPDGDGSTFHPKYTNIAIAYAKEFSNSIYGGITVKIINENIPNLNATGVAFDAGIQYITGAREQIKFGVTMKNVGPTLKMNGDGMAISASYTDGPVMTMQMRPSEFELPSLIKLGLSYDFDISDDHEIVAMAAFTENSFSKNQFHGGVQYSFRTIFMVRAGYIYEDGIMNTNDRTTAYTGISAGFSLEIPFKKGGKQKFGIDYSYRDTDPFDGTHSIGVRISL